MKSKLLLLLTSLALAGAPLARGVNFTLSGVLAPGDVRHEGQLVLAMNANGESVVVNGVPFTGRGFGFDPPAPPFDALWTASGADFFSGFASGPLANPGLDALYANGFVGTGTRRLTLPSLVTGAPYRLQLLIGDDTVAARAFSVVVLGETFSFTRSKTDPAQAIIAEFTGTGTSSEVLFIQTPGSAEIVLNAFALYQVPEPCGVALVAFGALALLSRRLRGAAAALLVVLPATGEAGLLWERTLEESRSTSAQEKASASFRFKNTGAAPVTIESIRSSCGCTTATLEKREYAPGESGEIVAEFRFGGRVGSQEKTVSVVTAAPDATAVVLTLRVEIEQAFALQPSLVFWRVGEAPEPKRIELRAAANRPILITAVESSDAAFKPEITTIKAGELYALTIVPTTTGARATATFTLKTDSTDAAVTLPKAFAIVR